MGWSEGFIAVDWGTSNRRAWRIAADGAVEARMADDRGILEVDPEEFPAEAQALRARLGDLPMLMAGMIGSNRGWVEAPYVAAPAGLDELAARLVWAEPERTAVVPGLSWRGTGEADVMRGEEVQILGACAAGSVPADAIVCHPGTHTKWARLEGGRIGRFRTLMTGELFSLLSEHSILSGMIESEARPDAAFDEGVMRMLGGGEISAELFTVRARSLLGLADPATSASYLSGLLIGADICFGLDLAGDGPVFVMGRPDLTALFATALRLADRRARELDGEQAFLDGARRLAELTR
jgi:2-dehydro-3-deoxygalactonokinase